VGYAGDLPTAHRHNKNKYSLFLYRYKLFPTSPPINVKDCANPRVVSHQGVHVEGVICDSTCKTVICQTYKNSETVPIEATYVFPLDEGAAVCGYVFFHALSFTVSSFPPPPNKKMLIMTEP